MCLDRATHRLIPLASLQAHMDSRSQKDVIVRRGEPPLGPGQRKCWNCGLRWILEPGQEDVCPRCGRPNVIEIADSIQRAKAEVLRAQSLLGNVSKPRDVSLSVGDLSLVTAQKDSIETQIQRLEAKEDGLTVGDLSLVTARKRNLAKKGLDELYVGPKPADFKPATSESQAIAARIMEAHRKKREEAFKIKQMMFEQKT
jgi:hypothetical protein